MKVGDIIKHVSKPEYGKGRIVSFQHHLGTVLVKFENFDKHTYHSPWVLEKA